MRNILILTLVFINYVFAGIKPLSTPAPKSYPSLETNRTIMLKLINQVRTGLRLNTLQLDETLNKLSQQHSVDMVNRNFFDHVNPDHNGPSDRAKLIGFKYSVGENIAIGSEVSNIHKNLMKSPGHYANTIDPSWTRCGIGFHQNNLNWLYVTIVFSTRDLKKYPISDSQSERVQLLVSKYILQTNTQMVGQEKQISKLIGKWLSTDKSIPVLIYIRNLIGNYKGPYSNQSIKLAWSDNIVEQLKKNRYFRQSNPTLQKFGVNLKIVDCMTEITAVYRTK